VFKVYEEIQRLEHLENPELNARFANKKEPSNYKNLATILLEKNRFESTITELTSYDEWNPIMFEKNKPIIIFCYADWCGPCKNLTPVLEKIAQEHEGKFKLIKLNIEKFPELAQGLDVKSIPALFMFFSGLVYSKIVGADELELKKLVNKARYVDHLIHKEDFFKERVLQEAQKKIDGKNYEGAEELLREGQTFEMLHDKFGA